MEQLKAHVGEVLTGVRGKGMEIGVRFKNAATCDQVQKSAFANGLYLVVGSQNNMQLMPPLTIAQEFLDEGLEILVA